jgi:hypothetical protein
VDANRRRLGQNQDGKGFNLLYLVPIDGSDIVMREAKDEGDAK